MKPGDGKAGATVMGSRGMASRHNNWPLLERVFIQSELMDRVMDKIGIPAVMAARRDQGAAILEARARCLNCHNETLCRHWLEASPALPPPPEFCPNARLFRALRARSCLNQRRSMAAGER